MGTLVALEDDRGVFGEFEFIELCQRVTDALIPEEGLTEKSPQGVIHKKLRWLDRMIRDVPYARVACGVSFLFHQLCRRHHDTVPKTKTG